MADTKKKKPAAPKKTRAAKPKTPEAPAPKKTATSRQLADLLGITMQPPLKPDAVLRLRKPLPGYVSVIDDVAAQLAEDGPQLNLDITPAELLAIQAEQKDIAAKEAVAEAVYTTAYHQRMQVDDRAMGMLQKIARRVASRAEEDPEILIRWKFFRDFLATFQGGRPKKKGEPEK